MTSGIILTLNYRIKTIETRKGHLGSFFKIRGTSSNIAKMHNKVFISSFLKLKLIVKNNSLLELNIWNSGGILNSSVVIIRGKGLCNHCVFTRHELITPFLSLQTFEYR